jgi:hypothetical protein
VGSALASPRVGGAGVLADETKRRHRVAMANCFENGPRRAQARHAFAEATLKNQGSSAKLDLWRGKHIADSAS